MSCKCFRDNHDYTMSRVNAMADTFSLAIILGTIGEGICPYAAKVMVGKVMAIMAARVYLMEIGEAEAEELDGKNIFRIPEVKNILETIHTHAQLEMEEVTSARN